MPLTFGVKSKDVVPSTGNGNYLRRFKNGETLVRFIDEIDEWEEFYEHFTPDKQGFPCTRDRATCPGCQSDNPNVSKASRRWATYVFLVKAGTVLPYALPNTLKEFMEERRDKNDGTVTNRDYAVVRSGEGMQDTKYYADQEDKYPMDLPALHKQITLTIQTCYQDSYDAVWGPPTGAEAREAAQSDVPPTKPATSSVGEPDDGELTESSIRKMNRLELRLLCTKGGVAFDTDDTKNELIDKLLAELGE